MCFECFFEGWCGVNGTDVIWERIPLFWTCVGERALAIEFGADFGDRQSVMIR